MTVALWGLDAAGWSAIAAWVAVLVGVVAAVVALSQLAVAVRARREQTQPYIAVSLEGSEAGDEFLELVVRNYGQTAAHDARLTFDPPLQRTTDGGTALEDVLVPDVFPVIVPGQEWRTFWDTTVERNRRAMSDPPGPLPPERHRVRVSFRDSAGRELGPLDYVLDWRVELAKGAIRIRGRHHTAEALRDISRTLKKVQDGSDIRVRVRDGHIQDVERKRMAEKRRKAAAKQPHLLARLRHRYR